MLCSAVGDSLKIEQRNSHGYRTSYQMYDHTLYDSAIVLVYQEIRQPDLMML